MRWEAEACYGISTIENMRYNQKQSNKLVEKNKNQYVK